MATISKPAAYIPVVAVLLLSGIGAGLPIDSIRADDSCVSAPGTATPQGQHWYYRIDRVKHRNCWYLHAAVPLPKDGAAKHRAALPDPVPSVATPQSVSSATPQAANAAPAPLPAADTSNTLSAPVSQPAPHVMVLTVKSVRTPFVGTISASQAAAPEQAGEPPMPPNNASVPVAAVAKPASGANPATVLGATDVDHNASAPADTAATASARTQSADLFFLLALALGIAAALLALCGKMAGRTRTPRLSDHPDDAWRRVIPEEDSPLLAPAAPHGPADLDAHERIERSPPVQAHSSAARPQDGEPWQPNRMGPILKDIELALRVLQQTRQGITQT
jgi:hypothetical protein